MPGIKNGATPLHKAAAYKVNPRVIVALLDGAADANAVSDSGDIPLHLAADGSVLPAIEALLAAGADPVAVNADGTTPFEVAEHTRMCRVARFCSDCPVSTNTVVGRLANHIC